MNNLKDKQVIIEESIDDELIQGINKSTFIKKPFIENDLYFVYGLNYLMNRDGKSFTEYDLENLPFNKRKNSKQETITGFTKKQFKNFMNICTDLGYLEIDNRIQDNDGQYYKSNLDKSMIDLVSKYGLMKINGFKMLSAQNATIDGLKTELVNKLNEIHTLENQLTSEKTKSKQLNKTISQIKNHTGNKLTKDDFVNCYLDIRQYSDMTVSSNDVLNGVMYDNDFNYQLQQTKYNYKNPDLYIPDLIATLDLNFKSHVDIQDAVNWLYTAYLNNYVTDKNGHIMKTDEIKNKNLNKVEPKHESTTASDIFNHALDKEIKSLDSLLDAPNTERASTNNFNLDDLMVKDKDTTDYYRNDMHNSDLNNNYQNQKF